MSRDVLAPASLANAIRSLAEILRHSSIKTHRASLRKAACAERQSSSAGLGHAGAMLTLAAKGSGFLEEPDSAGVSMPRPLGACPRLPIIHPCIPGCTAAGVGMAPNNWALFIPLGGERGQKPLMHNPTASAPPLVPEAYGGVGHLFAPEIAQFCPRFTYSLFPFCLSLACGHGFFTSQRSGTVFDS